MLSLSLPLSHTRTDTLKRTWLHTIPDTMHSVYNNDLSQQKAVSVLVATQPKSELQSHVYFTFLHSDIFFKVFYLRLSENISNGVLTQQFAEILAYPNFKYHVSLLTPTFGTNAMVIWGI